MGQEQLSLAQAEKLFQRRMWNVGRGGRRECKTFYLKVIERDLRKPGLSLPSPWQPSPTHAPLIHPSVIQPSFHPSIPPSNHQPSVLLYIHSSTWSSHLSVTLPSFHPSIQPSHPLTTVIEALAMGQHCDGHWELDADASPTPLAHCSVEHPQR